MASSAASPADQPNEDVRGRILTAARAEFAARGLAGASVRSIAGRAGVTAAMINYYFGGKRGLYDEVVDQAMSRLLARVQGALMGADDDEQLAVRLTGAYFDFLSEERDLQRLMMHEVLARGEQLATYTQRYLVPLRRLLDHQLDGEDRFQMAVSIFGAVAGYFLYEPVVAELLGDDPLSARRLEARRNHLVSLARRLAEEAR